ncbi:uracil-DNA glycosylase [Pseudohoeflea suaedae]|uniref:Type-5 uracil-DNA glycosylase n=1 Tax=Pseudohoeflea suaedae TaxID=877384 RepID=A0A4R5PJT6_9HYPH|nr:uracil-DNA glycosylase [Pseudohoeflea suaedae]TDH35845.1 uracil-DNA glycosylase [Pseudohoeflea suaedae]
MKRTDPPRDCTRCPRLRAYVRRSRKAHPDWFNAPVPTWYPPCGPNSVKTLVLGLAPGLKGANRTGRAFTGDASGELLFSTLIKSGFAAGDFANRPDDGLRLIDTAITNAVRCVPPGNHPSGAEIANCRTFLQASLTGMPNLRAIVTLGKIAHDSLVRALDARAAEHPFGHANTSEIDGIRIFASYHCSRYNVNTGRLTPAMLERVFAGVADYLG